MSNLTARPLLLLAALLAAGASITPGARAADGAAEVDLAPHWTAGQSARYAFVTRLEQQVEITLGDNQREQATETDIDGELTWTVDRVTADGGARCTMTLDWMAVVTHVEGEATRVDSRKSAPADSKVMHDLLKAMAGVPLEVVVAPDGRVKQVKGVKAMKARSDEPDLIPDVLDFEETASGLAQFAARGPSGDRHRHREEPAGHRPRTARDARGRPAAADPPGRPRSGDPRAHGSVARRGRGPLQPGERVRGRRDEAAPRRVPAGNERNQHQRGDPAVAVNLGPRRGIGGSACGGCAGCAGRVGAVGLGRAVWGRRGAVRTSG